MKSKVLILTLMLVTVSCAVTFGQPLITIDRVSGLNDTGEGYGENTFSDGATLRFFVRIANENSAHFTISNGYCMDSPNLTWDALTGQLNPTYKWDLSFGFPCFFDLGMFVNVIYNGNVSPGGTIHGSISDTIGFGGSAGIYGTGLPALFNDSAYWFTLGPIHGDQGDQLVIDSSWYPPAGRWVWDVLGAAVPWGGPYTYTLDTLKTDVAGMGGAALPTKFDMKQNYPNPFNPTTEILFDVPTRSHVQIKVYNVLGQMVTTLVDEERAAGTYRVTWDGTSDGGNKVSSGIYFYKMEADSFVQTKKMALLK
ncbi:MAG: FlgD immunoglobulin-like domain containing protein [Candidatus Zixiibacteriota bacterium]